MKSARGSRGGPAGPVAFASKLPTWTPLEAKAAALELMTLPTSPQQNNQENYSGQGKDQAEETPNNPTTRYVSGEEGEIEGSSEGGGFPEGFEQNASNTETTGVKLTTVTSASQTEIATLAQHTSLSQWQTLEQPTTQPQGSKEEDPAEEARGEILYIHRPTHIFSSTDLQRGEEGSNSIFPAVVQKHSEGTALKEVMDSTPEALLEPLTTSEMTTSELLTTRDLQDVDPTARAATTEESPGGAPTEELSISISWVQENSGKTSPSDLQHHLLPTPAPTDGNPATTGDTQSSTLVPSSDAAVTEMESRSSVSESFVVGSQWPFKNVSPKSEGPKSSTTTGDKDTHNPFGILVPNWTFGLISSGM